MMKTLLYLLWCMSYYEYSSKAPRWMEGVYWGYKTNDELETISSSFSRKWLCYYSQSIAIKSCR